MTGGAADTPFNAATTESPPRPASYPLRDREKGNSTPGGDAILMYFAFSNSPLLHPTPLLLLLPPTVSFLRHPLAAWEQVRLETEARSCFAKANGLDALWASFRPGPTHLLVRDPLYALGGKVSRATSWGIPVSRISIPFS